MRLAGRFLAGGLLGRLLSGVARRLLRRCLFLGLAARASLGLQAGLLLRFLASTLLLGTEHGVPLGDHLADRLGDQSAGADGVVVAGDHEVDPVRVAVRVDQPDDGDTQALRLFHRYDLGFQVDHEHRVRHPLHVLHAAEVRSELRQVGLCGHPLTSRQQRQLALRLKAFEVVQATNALVDGLEVRQQAAQPAVVDVGHARGLGHVADRVLRLLLGAHEQDGAAAVGERAGKLLGLRQQRGSCADR